MQPTRRPMTPEEYEALRRRAGYHDTPGAPRYRSHTSYVPEAICVGFALWLIPIIVIVKVLPPRDLVLPFGCGSLVVLLAGSLWFFRRRARRKDGVGDQLSVSRSWPALMLEPVQNGRGPVHGKFMPGPISR
jgi:hypothetical protein